jgi:hypothetical protein
MHCWPSTSTRVAAAALLAGLAFAIAALCGGCAEGEDAQFAAEAKKVIQAESQTARLQRELADARDLLAQRDRQVAELLGLGGPERMKKLYLVQRIGLGASTAAVDLDNKPGDDGVKVYVEPIDQYGSVLKAPGSVTVQLYDLAAEAKDNLVGQLRYDVDQTAKCWSSGFLAYWYSFTCPWKAGPPKHGQITVRVEFVDYLTGKKFEAQTIVRAALPPPATQPATGPAAKPGATKPASAPVR